MPSTRAATIASVLPLPLLLGAFALVGSAPFLADEVAGSVTLASVGPTQIEVRDFRKMMADRGGEIPGQFAEPHERRDLLDEMVDWEAKVLRARQAGYDQDADVVKVFERVMVRRYLQDRLDTQLGAVAVTDEEIQAYYDANPADFTRAARRQIALVLIEARDAGDQADSPAMQKAEQALAEARALDPKIRHFGDVARRYSGDRASRYKGGVIGWLNDGSDAGYKWGAEVTAAAMALEEPGEIAPIVRSEKGFYLVRLVDRETAETRPLDKVSAGIATRLRQAKQRAIQDELDRQLVEGLEIEIDEAVFAAIEPLSPPVPDIADRRPPKLPSR